MRTDFFCNLNSIKISSKYLLIVILRNSTASIAQFESKKELTETYKELYQTKKRECNVRAKLGFK